MFKNIDKVESEVRKILKANNFHDNPNIDKDMKKILTELRGKKGYDKRKAIRSFAKNFEMVPNKNIIKEFKNNISIISESISQDAVIETMSRARNEYITLIGYGMNVDKEYEFTNLSLREYLGVLFAKKIKSTLNNYPGRKISFDVYSNNLTFAISSKSIYPSDLTLEYIYSKFSHEELYAALDLTNIIVALKIRKHTGSGLVRDVKQLFNMTSGIYELDVEEYCGQACLFAALNVEKTNYVNKLSKKTLTNHAKDLAKTFCNKPSMDIGDFELFTQRSVRVITYNGEFQICGHFNKGIGKTINILLYYNHYYLVTMINKMLKHNESILCGKCDKIHSTDAKCNPFECCCGKPYKSLSAFNKHKAIISNTQCSGCDIVLKYEGCRKAHKCENMSNLLVTCKRCNNGFNTENRYKSHMLNGCMFDIKCDNCGVNYDSRKQHFCFLEPVYTCDKNKNVYVFDIECYGEETQEFAMAYIMKLDKSETIFIPDKAAMIKFIKDNDEPKVLYAHNGSKYDNFIILEMLIHENININDNVILKGRSPIKFTVNGIEFRDSMLLFSAPLSELPKMFGLQNISKTIFPYKALTVENKALRITDKIPKEYFNIEDQEHIPDFIKENKGKFLIDVCKVYCLNDVELLRQALDTYSISMSKICETLCDNTYNALNIDVDKTVIESLKDKKHPSRLSSIVRKYNLTKKEANIVLEKHKLSETNPLSSLTKASFAYKLFAKYTLKENLISYVPYSVDLFIRESFHGGKTCNVSRAAEKTPLQDKLIVSSDISSSYPACQLFNYLPTRFIEHKILAEIDYKLPHNKRAPLNISIIKYEPNKANFNACHAFIFGIFNKELMGFFRCDIEVPDILHPMLPSVLENGRLADTCYNIKGAVFCSNELELAIRNGYKVTCITEYALFERSTCIVNRSCITSDCNKIIEKIIKEKKYRGFFNYRKELNGPIITSDDTEIALIIGHTNIAEIVEYRLYDPDNWIFGDLILTLYGKKNSIDKSANPGLYTCIKILLNSVWGKMGEKAHPEKTSFYTGKETAKYINLLNKESKNYIMITNEYCIGDGVVCKYSDIEKDHTSPKSIAIAATITAWGRIRLYDGISHYDSDTLYYDTDSVTAFSKKSVPTPTVGYMVDGLGSWELEESDIQEYYSTAPKAYSYKRVKPVNGELYKISSKGIPVKSSTRVVFDNVEQILTKELAHKINKAMVCNNIPHFNYSMLQFRRDKQYKICVDPNYDKQVSYNSEVYDKRDYFMLTEDGRHLSYSLPLGYGITV